MTVAMECRSSIRRRSLAAVGVLVLVAGAVTAVTAERSSAAGDTMPTQVAVHVSPEQDLVPHRSTHAFEVTIWGQARNRLGGILEVSGPPEWQISPALQRFDLDSDGLPVSQTYTVSVTAQPEAGIFDKDTITFTASTDRSDGPDAARDSTTAVVEPIWSGDDVPIALDAGPTGSPVMETYHALTPETRWDPVRGYGWVDTCPSARDRGAPDLLRRDFTFSSAVCTLRLTVPPGIHQAFLLTGDPLYQSSHTVVYVDGQRVAETDHLLGAGEYSWLTFDLDGREAGRQVDIVLDGEDYQEYWRLGALVVE
ncbi:hypothetical protein ABN034_15970 [Actinopolymorpha sp. B11F2]|uniref:hypothetical protein n=1 Tax=Actinopolymorpha sp. B11F2 TaxID=3160862 RepID=UPI0032E45E45